MIRGDPEVGPDAMRWRPGTDLRRDHRYPLLVIACNRQTAVLWADVQDLGRQEWVYIHSAHQLMGRQGHQYVWLSEPAWMTRKGDDLRRQLCAMEAIGAVTEWDGCCG